MSMTGTLEGCSDEECKDPVIYGGKSMAKTDPNQEELKIIKETTFRVAEPKTVDTLNLTE